MSVRAFFEIYLLFVHLAQNPVFRVGSSGGRVGGGSFLFGGSVNQLLGVFAFRIVRAADESAEFAELDAETAGFAFRTAARIAAVFPFGEQVFGQHFVDLVDHFAHLQRRDGVDVFDKFGPETGQQLAPFHFPGGNVVEEFFHLCGKVIFDVFMEEIFKKCGDDSSAFFGDKAQFFHLDVFAFLQDGDDGRISGRPADAQFFQFFDQTGFGKARRRRGKVLVGKDFALGFLFARFDVRQDAVFVVFLFVVKTFLIKLQKAVKSNNLAVGAQRDLSVGGS